MNKSFKKVLLELVLMIKTSHYGYGSLWGGNELSWIVSGCPCDPLKKQILSSGCFRWSAGVVMSDLTNLYNLQVHMQNGF